MDALASLITKKIDKIGLELQNKLRALVELTKPKRVNQATTN